MTTGDNDPKLTAGPDAQGGARANNLGTAPTAREVEIGSAIQERWMKPQIAGGHDPAAADHGPSIWWMATCRIVMRPPLEAS
jgi:hypothetical protein